MKSDSCFNKVKLYFQNLICCRVGLTRLIGAMKSFCCMPVLLLLLLLLLYRWVSKESGGLGKELHRVIAFSFVPK